MSNIISSNRPGGGIKWHWPSIHPEGRKFLLIAGIVTLCFWLLGWEIVGWLMLGVTLWVGAFFRDPVRVTPAGSDVIIAPADGLITQIAEVPPPPEISGPDGLGAAPMLRVSIFMRVGFTQIAGLVARRIMPFVTMGNELTTGQRVGLIRFGSRVDVYLPAGTTPQVLLGQRTLAGETVVARIGTAETIDGIGQ